MSQMDEHNSTHTLLSAQMKNLNVSWLRSLVVLFRLNFVQHVSQLVEISQPWYFSANQQCVEYFFS